jgi:replicative DNA helicase Mcm
MSLKDYLSDLFREPKYRQQFAEMVNTASKTLIVDFEDLMKEPSIANSLVNNPVDWLKNAEEVARERLVIEDSEYAEKLEKVNVRVRNLPEAMPLRKVGASNINKLICVEGIVVRASSMVPKVLKATFKCPRCNKEIVKEQTGISLEYPIKCDDPTCNQVGNFRFLPEKTTYIDSQTLRIQEKPEDLPPGRMPRSLDCRIVGEELVDLARPGDHVRINGILRAVPALGPARKPSLTFDLYLEINDLVVQNKELELTQLDDLTIEKIKKLSKDPWIYNKIINSIAPSIYGSSHIKEAIMYLLFGGVEKHHPDIKIRGEINVFLIGDPGIAKSLLLQASAKLAPRGLYTSGRGTTAAGLTAAVLKDKNGEMTLEAGALVLADRGIAAVDELDKMKPEDRSAMHEALEQQTVSIAKAGIVATLNARTAVLAAANPKWGRYDTSRTIGENVELPITLLSRFDLIFIMVDKPDKAQDTEMSKYILDSHGRTETLVTPIPLDLLRQYIAYARQRKPQLTEEAKKIVQDYYLKLRDLGADRTGPIAITPRQLEGLIRIAEAHARIVLRNKVTVEDAQAAVAIFNESMQQVCFDTATGKMDRDILETGAAKSTHDKLKVAYTVVIELEKETGLAETEVVYKELEKKGISRDEAEALIGMLYRDNKIYEPRPGYLKRM